VLADEKLLVDQQHGILGGGSGDGWRMGAHRAGPR
jgi:hypothetical protein